MCISALVFVVNGVWGSIRDFHNYFAWVMVIGNGLVGFWALAAHCNEKLRGWPLWLSVAVAQITVLAQAVLGAVLVSVEDLGPPEFHLLYGSAAVISVGIIYGYRHQVESRKYLIYGLAGFFLMGLGVRAMLID